MFGILHYLNFPFYRLVLVCPSNSPLHVLPRSESDSEEDEGEEEEELPLLSEEEMNKLGAKLVKAEIMGNTVSWLSLCYRLSPYRAEYETTLIIKRSVLFQHLL